MQILRRKTLAPRSPLPSPASRTTTEALRLEHIRGRCDCCVDIEIEDLLRQPFVLPKLQMSCRVRSSATAHRSRLTGCFAFSSHAPVSIVGSRCKADSKALAMRNWAITYGRSSSRINYWPLNHPRRASSAGDSSLAVAMAFPAEQHIARTTKRGRRAWLFPSFKRHPRAAHERRAARRPCACR